MARPLLALLAWCVAAGATVAAESSPAANQAVASKAATSAAARNDAVKAIPLDKLDDKSRTVVKDIVNKATIFRRMPVTVVDCNPDLYRFLVRNPEVVVNIWQVMNVTTVTTERVKPGIYRATDGAGTACNIQFVHSSDDTHVILADGAYDGALFLRPVKARCVLVLKTGHVREADGRDYVTSRMDTFIDLDSAGVALLAKTVQPLVGKAADHNFTETSAFFGTLSRAAERNPAGVERMAARLTKVDAKVRGEFLTHTRAVQLAAMAKEDDGDTIVVSDAGPAIAPPANAAPRGQGQAAAAPSTSANSASRNMPIPQRATNGAASRSPAPSQPGTMRR